MGEKLLGAMVSDYSGFAFAELVHEWFERVWNRGDESAIDDLLSPAGVAHGLPGRAIEGPARLHAICPELQVRFSEHQHRHQKVRH